MSDIFNELSSAADKARQAAALVVAQAKELKALGQEPNPAALGQVLDRISALVAKLSAMEGMARYAKALGTLLSGTYTHVDRQEWKEAKEAINVMPTYIGGARIAASKLARE